MWCPGCGCGEGGAEHYPNCGIRQAEDVVVAWSRGDHQERSAAITKMHEIERAAYRERGVAHARGARSIVRKAMRRALGVLPYRKWAEWTRQAYDAALYRVISADFTDEGLIGSRPVYQSYFGTPHFTGRCPDGITIDELTPLKETAKVKPTKQPKKTYNTCGVRFLRGHNLQKVYTYRVPKKVKLHLGEEIVVPTMLDGYESNAIAVVIELHSAPQDNDPCVTYKSVFGRIARVK